MSVSYANRGRSFEQIIEYANVQYKLKGWGLIQKVPTPWRVLRKGKQIISAHPERKSTVDFVGVANGKAIAFDAKSTRERTRFPLSNIEQHQMDFLKQFYDQGGKAFILLEFVKFNETYLIPFDSLLEYWNKAMTGGRKSIPYSDMINFPLVRSNRGIVLDYLAAARL